jgi:pyrimidine nucleoside transport protein
LFLSIIAILIGFVAFLAFADAFVKWLKFLVGFEDVGIEFLFGKVFIPVAWALGVEWRDCEIIGHVIGTKTFVNEFVAFKLLGEYKKAGAITVRLIGISNGFIESFISR